MCDTCGRSELIRKTRKIMGGICVCESCMYKIIFIHISTHHIRTLCPGCFGKKKLSKPCDCCNLDVLINVLNGCDVRG